MRENVVCDEGQTYFENIFEFKLIRKESGKSNKNVIKCPKVCKYHGKFVKIRKCKNKRECRVFKELKKIWKKYSEMKDKKEKKKRFEFRIKEWIVFFLMLQTGADGFLKFYVTFFNSFETSGGNYAYSNNPDSIFTCQQCRWQQSRL